MTQNEDFNMKYFLKKEQVKAVKEMDSKSMNIMSNRANTRKTRSIWKPEKLSMNSYLQEVM